ncbi:MAG: cytochrome c [Polyangiaceae bacterium]|nr:cytochrome c [Polyangiaceae bacterium]
MPRPASFLLLAATAAAALGCRPPPGGAPSTRHLAEARLAAPEGGRAYNLYCASCHGERGAAPDGASLVDGPALGARFATGLELLEYVEQRMPPGDRAGSLEPREYLAIAEYVLRARGLPVPRPFDRAAAAGVRLTPAGAPAR